MMRRILGVQVTRLFLLYSYAVFKEMESVIKDVITKSYADTSYDKAIKAVQAYRSEAIDVRLFTTVLMIFQLDEPRQFNEYLQSLKEDLLAGKLNGNRRDFWNKMKSEKIGLITFEESEVDQIEGIGEAEVKKVILRYDHLLIKVFQRLIGRASQL
jgi:hypothetical protein